MSHYLWLDFFFNACYWALTGFHNDLKLLTFNLELFKNMYEDYFLTYVIVSNISLAKSKVIVFNWNCQSLFMCYKLVQT